MMSKKSEAKPPFIVFEGIDGSGKGTQIKLLADHLAKANRPFIITREPGGTPLGQEIREHLLSGAAKHLGPIAEVMLFNADRADHMDKIIRPALARGSAVICDRFTTSTLAYQGAGGGVDEEWLKKLHGVIVGPNMPDATIVLDIPIEVSLERQRMRGNGKDRYEKENLAFFHRLRQKYLEIAGDPSSAHILINGNQPENVVQDAIMEKIAYLLSWNQTVEAKNDA